MAHCRRPGRVRAARLARLIIFGAAGFAVTAQAEVQKLTEREVFRSTATPPEKLTLGQAVNWALEHNLALKRVEAEIDRHKGRMAHANRPVPSNPRLELSTKRKRTTGGIIQTPTGDVSTAQNTTDNGQ